MAINKLMSHKDRMEIKERTRYIMIDPDSDEVESKLEQKKLSAVSPLKRGQK